MPAHKAVLGEGVPECLFDFVDMHTAKPSLFFPFLPVVCRNCCEHMACNSSTQCVLIVLRATSVCGIGDKPLCKLKWLFRIALLLRRTCRVSIRGGYVRCCAASFVFGGVYHCISHQMPVRPFLCPGKVAPALLLRSSVVFVFRLLRPSSSHPRHLSVLMTLPPPLLLSPPLAGHAVHGRVLSDEPSPNEQLRTIV